MSTKVMVFCPRGCNVSHVSADDPYDECGACGAIMTTDEDSYDAVHEMMEDNAIIASEARERWLDNFKALADGTKFRDFRGQYWIKPEQVEQLEGSVINLVTGKITFTSLLKGLKPIYPIQKNLRK